MELRQGRGEIARTLTRLNLLQRLVLLWRKGKRRSLFCRRLTTPESGDILAHHVTSLSLSLSFSLYIYLWDKSGSRRAASSGRRQLSFGKRNDGRHLPSHGNPHMLRCFPVVLLLLQPAAVPSFRSLISFQGGKKMA